MAREFGGPSAREIANMLRDHTEEIARMIFPAAVQAGGFLCIGSIYGERGDSLKITLRGPKRGTWADYATSASDPNGMGDMLKLLQLTLGDGDLRRGIEEAKRFLNLDTMDPKALERMKAKAARRQREAEQDKAAQDERKRREAQGLWMAATPLTASSPPVRYLEGRGIDFAALGKLPGAIRFHHRVIHAETSERRGEKAYLPAMVTRYNAIDGSHAATHVTFLHYDGAHGWVKLPPVELEKMDPDTGELTAKLVKAAKKTHGPTYWGAHLPIWKGAHRCSLKDLPAGAAVYVAEGIEDALSYAMADPEARVLGAGTLGNIAVLKVPPQAGDFVLLAQNDSDPKPIASREAAIKAQQAQAREQGSARRVRLKFPLPAFKDWNDWLNDAPMAGAKA